MQPDIASPGTHMPSFIESFFDALRQPAPEERQSEAGLRLATAALLIEMMRADAHTTDTEEAELRGALRQEFDLEDQALESLIAQARTEARDAPGYYAFTHRINAAFSLEQKLRLMEYLWRVALSDGHVAPHENHLMRKLADLIHIGHGDYHAAKARARHYLETKQQPA